VAKWNSHDDIFISVGVIPVMAISFFILSVFVAMIRIIEIPVKNLR